MGSRAGQHKPNATDLIDNLGELYYLRSLVSAIDNTPPERRGNIRLRHWLTLNFSERAPYRATALEEVAKYGLATILNEK